MNEHIFFECIGIPETLTGELIIKDTRIKETDETRTAVSSFLSADPEKFVKGRMIHVRKTVFDEDAYKMLRAEADRWQIDETRIEQKPGKNAHDPRYGSTEKYREVRDEEILVRDGEFWGIIAFVHRADWHMYPYEINVDRYEFASIEEEDNYRKIIAYSIKGPDWSGEETSYALVKVSE